MLSLELRRPTFGPTRLIRLVSRFSDQGVLLVLEVSGNLSTRSLATTVAERAVAAA